MLLVEREELIVSLVQEHGVVSVHELAEACAVTEVTIRRDLRKLEARNLLRRTRGGAVRVDKALAAEPTPSEAVATEPDLSTDALVLAPVQHSAIHTLRERALRTGIPLLAESCPCSGALYLGPNNYEAAFHLGRWTGHYVQEHLGGSAQVLDITQEALPNTRTRSIGFAEGLHYVLGDRAQIFSIDGRGLFNEAYQVSFDALRLHPEVNVLFGINDDSIIAGLQAYQALGYDPARMIAVNVGGEGKTLLDHLHGASPLKACMALFPERVGQLGVEAIVRLWAGEDLGEQIVTPSALLTADNLARYYRRHAGGWQLIPEAVAELDQTRWDTPLPAPARRRISFVIHYRTHEWYQNVAAAMQEHAARLGIALSVVDVNDNLQAESRELRRLIGKMAARYVNDGDTIILDAGVPTANMAQFLHGYRHLHVITNSLAVFQALQHNPAISLTLTGGEFYPDAGAFIGRGGKVFLREIRADKAFIVADGVSASFGISAKTLAEAEIRRAMLNAAREVVVLADHTVLGADANARVCALDQVQTVITDAGSRAEHRLDLHQRGIKVLIAGQIPNGSAYRDGGVPGGHLSEHIRPPGLEEGGEQNPLRDVIYESNPSPFSS